MKFFLVDDDDVVRAILTNIIEEEDLGTIEGEAADGSEVYGDLLEAKQIDILMIDILMPDRDGIETIRTILPAYKGKIVVISQVETKELVGKAFSYGIEYYILKPINRLEVVTILNKVRERILLEHSIQDISACVDRVRQPIKKRTAKKSTPGSKDIRIKGKQLLAELGVTYGGGYTELLDLLEMLWNIEHEQGGRMESVPLSTLFEKICLSRYGHCPQLHKAVQCSEQRVRRAVRQSLNHLASLGASDYSNPVFDYYAPRFFNFEQVRAKMQQLKNPSQKRESKPVRVDTKKFIQSLYLEVTRND